MNTRVVVRPQVKEFLDTLAPEPRLKLLRGIKGLAREEGDIKQLEGKLAAYFRLRVGRMRVIYEARSAAGERQLICFFADYRATVYAVLEQLLASGLIEELRER
jgi:mRNA-degrading endonuclease RelE of RelBE toxin-antitoxin system